MSENDTNEISKMLQFVPQVADIFEVKDKVGEGTFSKVFRAIVKNEKRQEYALKYLIPTSKPTQIASELQCLKDIGFDSAELSGEIKGCIIFRSHTSEQLIYVLIMTAPIPIKYIGFEEKDFQQINGSCNIVGIEFCLMNKTHVVIVMPYHPHQRFSDYVRHMTIDDAREYMKNLFIALNKIHSYGIIHRDVKPNNFLYNENTKSYTLVDFGLAQRMSDIESFKLAALRQPLSDSAGRFNKNVLPNQENGSKKRKLCSDSGESLNGIAKSNPKLKDPSKLAKNKIKECGCFKKPTVCKICLARETEDAPRGGTPGFRAPEVLLKFKNQTTAIDMWSAGVILLSILSKKYPFFRADDDMTALAEITFLVGTKEIKEAALSLGKILTMNLPETTESVSDVRKQLGAPRYLQALCTMIQQEQPCFTHKYSKEKEQPTMHCIICHEISRKVPESAFDLMNRLLDPNPHTRITAAEALQHPFITRSS